MKKFQLLMILTFGMILAACSSEPMAIVTGKDFIQKRAVVVDTASVFHSSDQFVMQFRYGKNFDFSKIKWEVLSADGKTVSSKTSPVNAKEGSYTIIVSSVRKGGIANAAEFFRAKEGSFRIRFSNADADTLLLEKQVRVVLNSEKIDGE
ncbi:MAG: hypothetical protein J6Z31_01305 [Fibrobacter sp.]|nr:hypothetical protein [Fibrobacter sp.]